MSLRSMLHYFFARSRRANLPLLPLKYSSRNNPWGDIPDEHHEAIRSILARSVARTPQDAYRLLKANPGLPVAKLIAREMRKRRRLTRWRLIWVRFKRIWIFVLFAGLLMLPAPLHAQDEKETPTPTLDPTAAATVEVTRTPTPIPLPWHGYILLEIKSGNMTFTPDFQGLLQAALSRLSPFECSRPDCKLQVGPCNVAGTACIIEAYWTRVPDEQLVIGLLAPVLSSKADALGLFIGVSAFAQEGTYQQSQDAVRAYLEANRAEWETPVVQ